MKLSQYIEEFNQTLGSHWSELKVFIYGIFAFLNLDINIVKVLLALMMIDTFLGVIKSIYVNNYIFSFKKLFWGIISKCVILILPMILALVALGLDYDFRWLTDIIIKILIVSEAISALTNIISIKEKKPIQNGDFITKLLHNIRNVMINKLNSLMDNINEK